MDDNPSNEAEVVKVKRDDNQNQPRTPPRITRSMARASLEEPIHPAMTNPLILSRIFRYLPPVDLKRCRLVSKDWVDLASVPLGKRTRLNPNKIMDVIKVPTKLSTKVKKFPGIDSHLIRQIKVVDVFKYPLKRFPRFLANIEKLINYERHYIEFIKKYSNAIEDIVFCSLMENPKYFDLRREAMLMKPIFEEVVLPKLKKITINVKGNNSAFSEALVTKMTPKSVPLLPNVTILEFDVKHGCSTICDEEGDYEYDVNWYLPLVQMIIDKSPNVEKLAIMGNLYPDLSNCSSKLKYLEWSGSPVKPAMFDYVGPIELWSQFSLAKLVKLLNQVRKGLEELILGSTALDEYGDITDSLQIYGNRDLETLTLPTFPNLVKLTIDPVNGFTVKFRNLTQRNFPSLKNFKMFAKPRYGLYQDEAADVLGDVGVWTTVEDICLDPVHCHFRNPPLPSDHLTASLLPNLKKMDTTLCECTDDEERFGEEFCGYLAEIAHCGWNLEVLVVRFGSRLTLSKLMEGIGEAGFKRLKSLHLIPIDREAVNDAGCDNFEKAFLSIPKITFEGFRLKASTLPGMLDFISRNNLNIYFIN